MSSSGAASVLVVLPAQLAEERLGELRTRIEAAGWRVHASRGSEQSILLVEGAGDLQQVEALVPPELDADVLPVPSAEEAAGARRRRALLTALAAGLVLIVATGAALPIIAFLRPPRIAAERGGIAAVRVADLRPDVAKRVLVRGRPVLLVQPQGERAHALAATCTFAGSCLLEWDAERGAIACPLHAVLYGLDGGVLIGPATEPLETFQVELVGDRYRIGGGP